MNALVSQSPATDLVPVQNGQLAPVSAPDAPRHRNAAAANRSRAGSKKDDYVFEPNESAFCVEQEVTIHSRPIQIAFERTFQRCQLALFEIEIIAPIIAHDDDAVRAITKAVDSKLIAFEQYMNNEVQKVVSILQQQGRSVTAGGFSKPAHFNVKIYSPRARIYAELLKQSDQVITAYARAFFEGLMDNEIEYKRAQFNIRMRAIRLSRELFEIHDRSYKSLQRARLEAVKAREAASNAHEQALLDARIQTADRIVKTVEDRGGMETAIPDFGLAEAAADDPVNMQREAETLSVPTDKVEKPKRSPRKANGESTTEAPAEATQA